MRVSADDDSLAIISQFRFDTQEQNRHHVALGSEHEDCVAGRAATARAASARPPAHASCGYFAAQPSAIEQCALP